MTDHIKLLTTAADKLEAAHTARDQAIVDAHTAGTPVTAIANAVRLSRMQVHRIINAQKSGPYPADAG